MYSYTTTMETKYLSNILNLPRYLIGICKLYLSYEENIYYENEWHKFPTNYICRIAERNGWNDLLRWACKKGYDFEKTTFLFSMTPADKYLLGSGYSNLFVESMLILESFFERIWRFFTNQYI